MNNPAVDFMTDGLRVLAPLVEARYGRLPDFDLCRARSDWSKTGGNMSFVFDLRHHENRLLFYPKSVEKDLQEKRYGWLIFGYVHELTHFYALDHVRDNVYLPWYRNGGRQAGAQAFSEIANNFRYSREGMAELAAVDLCFDLVASGKSLELLNELFDLKLGASDSDPLADYLAERLGQVTAFLCQRDLIDSLTVQSLSLPFELSSEMVRKGNEQARQEVDRVVENAEKTLPYRLGLYRCALVVSSGQKTLLELLKALMPDDELERMAYESQRKE